MSTDLPNIESRQLAHALERLIPAGPERGIIAREIAACLWNMVCECVQKQVKPEETR